ncbi:MAG: carboxypeptidase regulatory-like domain-containing protein, partial [bacterium]|nr:carboxypeptidase regulatory-like domain-containing protein [bacterium]
VIGRVVDREQRPLQAIVTKGPFREDSKNGVTCDANGWFRFNNVTAGVEVFTAQCAGAAPQVLPVEIKPDMPPVIFTLEPANIINGRVVEVNGEPIKDASIEVAFWQGTGSVSFETKTDAGGYFEWPDAPADEASFDIRKSGYMSVRNFAMKSGSDYTIRLLPPFRIGGSVTSSLPNLPVGTFKIEIGYYNNANLSWQDANSQTISSNSYELIITEPLDFQLKAQADGFKPAESPVFTPDQNAAKYDFVLNPLQ